MRKEVRELVEQATARGWTWEYTRSGHLRLKHPNGGQTIMGTTPSDHRGRKNALARLKRLERGTDTDDPVA